MPGKRARSRKLSRFAIASFVCAIGIVVTSLSALSQKQTENKSPSAATVQPTGKAFRRPADASAALYAAARRDDENELLAILGPDAKDLVNWTDDPNERAEQRKMFADKYDQMHRLVKEPDNTVALYVGAENWPVPVPIVEYKGKWYFDADLGKQEVLYRRIGRNEMEALQVCQALVDAEKEYYSAEHKYTANFTSKGNAHDGLYWKASTGEQQSPVGPFLARAGINPSTPVSGEPYDGYYYRILIKPNSAANAEGGFAVLAFPAEYRSSGVKTFMIEQDGMAYETDLGTNTAESAKHMNASGAETGWTKVE
jgi:Protein of unknown function (DUF2950)